MWTGVCKSAIETQKTERQVLNALGSEAKLSGMLYYCLAGVKPERCRDVWKHVTANEIVIN